MEIERRNKWIGIIIGACFVPIGFFFGNFPLDTAANMIIFSILGGFISGLLSQGNVKDGIKSGAMSGFFGSMVIAFSIGWVVGSSLLEGTAGFIEGLATVFIPVIIALAVLFASAGGIIGAICKKALFGDGKQGKQKPEQPPG